MIALPAALRTSTDHVDVDVAVVGAGPAGIAACLAATRSRQRVALLDTASHPGGQIWRHAVSSAPPRAARPWLERLARAEVTRVYGASVVDLRRATNGFELLAERGTNACTVTTQHIVLATGARERFLPFPGWTLPNVVGVGAVQALLKAGASMRDKRIVIAGTGPLLLPVAASLARAGARVVLLAEHAPARDVVRFGASLWRSPALLLQAARYRADFARTRYITGAWVTAADGDARVERATVTNGRETWTVDCDLLCVAYGLVPCTELARLAGCECVEGSMSVDERQESSVRGIYGAGETTGIGGAELALVEGEIAGLSASGRQAEAAPLLAHRSRLRAMSARMLDTFAPRAELRSLCRADTIVCRCEDVVCGSLNASWTSRQAKLYTRAGMGPCQGRVCGAALEFLFGWTPDTIRAPIEPILLSTFLADAASDVASVDQGAV
jgi:D-hydroxyproline dehydrogenase subunit alpha